MASGRRRRPTLVTLVGLLVVAMASAEFDWASQYGIECVVSESAGYCVEMLAERQRGSLARNRVLSSSTSMTAFDLGRTLPWMDCEQGL